MPLTLLADTAPAASSGGFDPISILLPVLLILFIFMMFRKQKKAKQQQQTTRSQIVPGTEVMTSFGLFGTVLSVDQDENKAVIEISPGNTATVHLQTLTKVISGQETADVPDDASSLTEGSGNSDGESADETIARLNREEKNRDN